MADFPPGKERTPDDGPIFCFGANERGAHGSGSAAAAHANYGAKMRVGNGLTGQSYGIPTCAYNDTCPKITPLTEEKVEQYVAEFVAYAKAHPELLFMMTKIGTGVGNFPAEFICKLLSDAPRNVDMPLDWCDLMKRKPAKFALYEELYPIDAIRMKKYHLAPMSGGYLLKIDGYTKAYRWNTDRCRVQQVHEALRFDAGFVEAGLVETLNPDEDGVTHVNIYSQGKTEIGRFLSNFAAVPFDTVEDGSFKSVEGYWYWLCTPETESRREELRWLSGFDAKKLGRELRADDWRRDAAFVKKITDAIEFKLVSNAGACDALADTGDLPLVHYYNYKGKVVEPKDGKWVIDWMYVLRDRVRKAL
jgi:hypothetical protein